MTLEEIIFPYRARRSFGIVSFSMSLIASAVFAWRAHAWTRARIEGLRGWGGAASAAYGEKIAARRIGRDPRKPAE